VLGAVVVDAGSVEVVVPLVADGVVLGPLPDGYVTFGTVLAELSNKMTELLIYPLVSVSSAILDHAPIYHLEDRIVDLCRRNDLESLRVGCGDRLVVHVDKSGHERIELVRAAFPLIAQEEGVRAVLCVFERPDSIVGKVGP